MQDATTRNLARNIESQFVSRIAAHGITNVAKAIGVNKSQVSRWQSEGGLVGKASLLMAIVGFDAPENTVIFKGEDTAEVARMLMEMLAHIREPKEKAPAATEAI